MEDNIWTLDGDGELRLSLMATLAQEESRKVSERVKAGQHVSREKGTLYDSGNILGYDRMGDTYVLNPDQAETVRMIYDMYLYEGMGTGKIATRLTELGRLNASGVNKWAHGVVSRVLNNQTYMGVMAYGKSFSNNYLEQRRVNNFDRSTYMYVQGNFPAIVTEEEWHRVQEIKQDASKTVSTPMPKCLAMAPRKTGICGAAGWSAVAVALSRKMYGTSMWTLPPPTAINATTSSTTALPSIAEMQAPMTPAIATSP